MWYTCWNGSSALELSQRPGCHYRKNSNSIATNSAPSHSSRPICLCLVHDNYTQIVCTSHISNSKVCVCKSHHFYVIQSAKKNCEDEKKRNITNVTGFISSRNKWELKNRHPPPKGQKETARDEAMMKKFDVLCIQIVVCVPFAKLNWSSIILY